MTDDWQPAAVDWLTMPHPDPRPPQIVIDALARDGLYSTAHTPRRRRPPRDARDAAVLMLKRDRSMRSRWRKRLEAWVDRNVEERSWEAYILRREGGYLLPPARGPIEQERRREIARARAMSYFKPQHTHDGTDWAW